MTTQIRVRRTFIYESDWMNLPEAYEGMTLEEAKEYEKNMPLADLIESGILSESKFKQVSVDFDTVTTR